MKKNNKNLDAKLKMPEKENLNKWGFNPFNIVLALLIVWSIFSVYSSSIMPEATKEVPMSEVFNLVKSESVDKVVIQGNKLTLTLRNGDELSSNKEGLISFYELLSIQEINPDLIVGGISEKQEVAWVEIILNLIVPIAMIVFFFYIFRQAGRSSGGIFSIGKSKAKLFLRGAENQIGFSEVAGADEIKNELVEIVDFLKFPEKYRKLGARIPRGVLLIGPSGVGKTLLARAIAGEAGVPFYSVAGSEFIEMIVGVGSARVRDLFKMAKESSPSLIFIDEIDAIGRQRGRGMAGNNDEREQTLNQILVEMDGFDQRTNVIIIAATNRPDMLDSALIRPGRFDRHIRLELPDVKEREEIIKIHMKGKPFASEVDIKRLARQTVGFSGADLENMLNEAAILAARRSGKSIETKDLTEASTKVKLGPGKKLLQTEEERKVIAYHEAGHALVATMNEKADPVTRISIISRSMSLGHTEFVPESGSNNQTKGKLLAAIQSLLGGRAAEEVVFSEQTIGASNDIERATYIARKMVTDFGMSKLGPINYVESNESLWDVRAQNKSTGYSNEIARQIDTEVSEIITTQLEESKQVIIKNRKVLDLIVNRLLEVETLEQDEFEKIIKDSGIVIKQEVTHN
ncbi:cell division protein FtsH [candidate division WWE3 bacterium CG_4_9_14_3_um_filter_34_6]|uniref:ATP-dependent zinc metalloprotease FtsH n=1 Tax=candidate division WWE3 bacterium CG_4_9_14_3_um_filter_34_6 TaxID=1975079 RepID=A0A2M7X5N3_UNCKA|nr:MAG: cell division protein FtsH [candidate division WWE3 bacterium CG_4_9_14_3_um_filter_34_6]